MSITFKIKPLIGLVLFFCFLPSLGSSTLYAEDSISPEGLITQTPGSSGGEGTHFEVKDSDYLNITLDSSEPVKANLSSIPEMLILSLEGLSGAVSSQITLSGFLPQTTYYKYEDDYHNKASFVTDNAGKYIYTQDLSKPHIIFFQPRASTIFLKETGWSDPAVGTWDPVTRIATLTKDITETIQIDANNIILDGNGYTLIGSNTGSGVYISQKSYVTLKNFNVRQFSEGIRLYRSNNIILCNNASSNNWAGIHLIYSNGSVLSDNTISANSSDGLKLTNSDSNILTGNVIAGNKYGLYVYYSRSNKLSGNAVSASTGWNFGLIGDQDEHFENDIDISNIVDGKPIYYIRNAKGTVYDNSTNAGTIYCVNCSEVTVKDLTFSNNGFGVFFWKTNNSRIENTKVINKSNSSRSKNEGLGFYLDYSDNNVIRNNSASNCGYGIWLSNGKNNLLWHNTIFNSRNAGLLLWTSHLNSLTENTITDNSTGMLLQYSSSNTATHNNVLNSEKGLDLFKGEGNIFINNVFNSNALGVYISYSNSNKIYHNNFVQNVGPAKVLNSSNNVFNLDKPDGGNYWDTWAAPDIDNDGFVDNPFTFIGGLDSYPWVKRDGWLSSFWFEENAMYTSFDLSEVSSSQTSIAGTFDSNNAAANNLTVTGDLSGTLNLSEFEIVSIKTGSFVGQGFFQGLVTGELAGVTYQASWKGMSYLAPAEQKIYLRGEVLGEINGIVDGYLIESITNSGIYDKYCATWKINRLDQDIVAARLGVEGLLSYQGSHSFTSEVSLHQTNMKGRAYGYYTGPLDMVITQLILNGDNECKDKGFSIISYESAIGAGHGYCYTERTDLKAGLAGIIESPLFGKLSAFLDKSASPKTFFGIIERVDFGESPKPDLKINLWGPQLVSPGETIDYIIEYRNEGMKSATEAIVYFYPDPIISYKSASQGAYYNNFAHRTTWNLGALGTRSLGYLSVQMEVPWGLSAPLPLENRAYILDIDLHSSEENGIANGIRFDPADNNGNKDLEQLAHNNNAKWFKLYSNTNIITGPLETYLASKDIATLRNGVGQVSEVAGYRPQWIGFSGGATTLINQAKQQRISGEELYLISPQSITQEDLEIAKTQFNKVIVYQGDDLIPDEFRILDLNIEIEQVQIDKNSLINIANSIELRDSMIIELINKVEESEGNKKFNYLELFPGEEGNRIRITWDNGSFTDILTTANLESREGIDVITMLGIEHAEWAALLNKYKLMEFEALYGKRPSTEEDFQKLAEIKLPATESFDKLKEAFERFHEKDSSEHPQELVTAHDPNELFVSPEGDIRPGDRLNYTINYENEGDGNAYGVYITDTLEEDLDESTLTINNGGTYNPRTKTVSWFIGELPSKQKGSVTFSINVGQNTPDSAEVINFATVYFPSVPEATRTNGTVNRITTYIDNTPPSTSVALTPTPNPSGWNNTDLIISLSASDNEQGSGIKELHYRLTGETQEEKTVLADSTQISITAEGITTLTYWSIDDLSNAEEPKSLEIKIDKTQPTVMPQISLSPNPFGWNNIPVTVSFTAVDALSGIASLTGPITVDSEGENQFIGGEAVDLAGNRATTSASINLDLTPPQVVITSPTQGAGYILDSTITSDWQATDTLSGIASATGTVPNATPINTNSVGLKSFNVVATDKAGNSIELLHTYYVRYFYSGILPPINPDGSSIFKLGRVIPVKFQLKDALGNFIPSATAKIYLTKISSNITGNEIEAESVGQANTGNLFRYSATDNQYIFNLSTNNLSKGTWQIRIELDDGSSKYVTVSLR